MPGDPNGLASERLGDTTGTGADGHLEVGRLTDVPVVSKASGVAEALEGLVRRLGGNALEPMLLEMPALLLVMLLGEPLEGRQLKLLVEPQRRENLAQREPRPLTAVIAQQSLDHVRVFDRVELGAVRGVLLAEGEVKASDAHL